MTEEPLMMKSLFLMTRRTEEFRWLWYWLKNYRIDGDGWFGERGLRLV